MGVLLYCACAVFIVGILVERVLEERAWKLLTSEETSRETEGLSGVRTLGVLLYVVWFVLNLVMVVSYSVAGSGWAVPAWVLPVVLGFLLLAGGCYQVYVQHRVRALALSKSYRTALSWSQGSLDVAVVVACVLIGIHIYG